MTETALATRSLDLNLANLNVKQLRILSRDRDKDRMVDLLKAGANFAHAILENEVILIVGYSVVANWLLQRFEEPGEVFVPGCGPGAEGHFEPQKPQFPYLESSGVSALSAAVIAITLAKAGVIENIGDAVGKIRGGD